MTRAVLSRMEAANYLGISTDTLDRLRASGAIVAAQVSARLVKYRAADLDAYIAQCQSGWRLMGPAFKACTCEEVAS